VATITMAILLAEFNNDFAAELLEKISSE